MLGIMLSILLLKIEHNPPTVDTFDLVEVNHHLNEWGQERWTQVIFWNWHKPDKTYHVEHYYMLKDCYQYSKSGEVAHNKMLDVVERFIPDIRERQRFRQESAYRGDFNPVSRYPEKDWKTNSYIIEYDDYSTKRKIVCKHMQQTYTHEDPEMLDRKRQPIGKRLGLQESPERKITSHLLENIQKALRQ